MDLVNTGRAVEEIYCLKVEGLAIVTESNPTNVSGQFPRHSDRCLRPIGREHPEVGRARWLEVRRVKGKAGSGRLPSRLPLDKSKQSQRYSQCQVPRAVH